MTDDSLAQNLWRSFLNIIFPSCCLGCRKNTENGEIICEPCFQKIEINQTLFCGECRARLALNKKICHPGFPYLLGAAADYQDEMLKSLIHGFKFQSLRTASRPLAEILIKYWENISLPGFNQKQNFVVIPIPLAKSRERQRGFNQAQLLAEIFARHFNLPVQNKVLVRRSQTKAQSELKNFAERRQNVKNCFAINDAGNLPKKNIILIDDVITSGATFFEASRALKSAGVKKIIALAVAKA